MCLQCDVFLLLQTTFPRRCVGRCAGERSETLTLTLTLTVALTQGKSFSHYLWTLVARDPTSLGCIVSCTTRSAFKAVVPLILAWVASCKLVPGKISA